LLHRPFGPFGWLYWVMLVLTVGTPQLFWSARARQRPPILFGAAIAILIGMWIERFVIVVTSLAQDGLPSSWSGYVPTWVDWGILVGSLSIFGLFFLLFLRFVPAAVLAELRRDRFEKATGARW
jgi:molybdopterin-containing oxidoreductase family membrane subunit